MQVFNIISIFVTLAVANALQGGEHRGAESSHHSGSGHNGDMDRHGNNHGIDRGHHGRNGQYDNVPQYCIDFYANAYGFNPYSETNGAYVNFQNPPYGCPSLMNL